jgi:hypothetical protein
VGANPRGRQRAGHRGADAHPCRDAGAVQREVGAIDQLDVRVGQGGEHHVAVKAQHRVAAVQRVRRGGVFPDDVGAAQRRNGLGVVRIGRAMKALQKLAREKRIDDLWHGVLLSITALARFRQDDSGLCQSISILRCRRPCALMTVNVHWI